MKRWLACLLLITLHSATARADKDVRIRRFALIVGANDGGVDRVKLRYAGTDATAVAKVLEELGGVAKADVVLLLDPDRAALEEGFDAISTRIEAANSDSLRTELLVYYSGHSDEDGLLLFGKRYSYKSLRERIHAMPSDVNIAILDSCASGAFTRRKGGKRVAAFLVDESTKVKGYAFLTSSSADEAAQESDRIGASFFTHYLVSGMRGGADANRDGLVTLNEAYQFAFGETVTRTETTSAGTQHPSYDIHLVGTGDVVMTDLRATSAALVVAKDVEGRLFIKDSDGRLVIELQKPSGRPVVLGLGPETYDVTLQRGDEFLRASVRLTRGKRTQLAIADFHTVDGEATVARGAGPPGADIPDSDDEYVHVPFRFQLLPSLGGRPDGPRELNQFSLNLLVGRGDALRGVEIGGLVNIRDDSVVGVQIAGIGNYSAREFEGAQLAGVANFSGGPFEGVQASGVSNVASDRFKGAQLAGVVNIARGDVRGVQISGVYNHAERHIEGAQIGLVNIGSSVRGAQIGLVNIARRMHGLQVGLVNISEETDGVPIGLVSLARNSRHRFELWGSDTGHSHIGVRLGAGNVYSLLAVAASDETFMAGVGMGLHFPMDGMHLDVDAVGYGVRAHDFEETDTDFLGKLRVSIGAELNQHIALFAGVSANAAFDIHDGDSGDGISLIKGKRIDADEFVLRLSPGFFAGVSFF